MKTGSIIGSIFGNIKELGKRKNDLEKFLSILTKFDWI
jgi:hypothetical protein